LIGRQQFGSASIVERFELRPRKPTPAACFFHVSRDFRGLRGRQILVRGQLLLHLAALWCVEPLFYFFGRGGRCARLVWGERRARASNQERQTSNQRVVEHSPDWFHGVNSASVPVRACFGFIRSPRRRGRGASAVLRGLVPLPSSCSWGLHRQVARLFALEMRSTSPAAREADRCDNVILFVCSAKGMANLVNKGA
jgi:hypothetical protein